MIAMNDMIAESYDFPEPLELLLDHMLYPLPAAEADDFCGAIQRAVGDGRKNMSLVVWAFLAATLRDIPPQPEKIQKVIDRVIAGMDLLASGSRWPEAGSIHVSIAAFNPGIAGTVIAYAIKAAISDHKAYVAARDADDALVRCNEDVARAATKAAHVIGDRKSQRELIVRLMAEAPALDAR